MNTERPYVICHMLISREGRVAGKWLGDEACAGACREYYRIHGDFYADAFACGRVTMDESFVHGHTADLSACEGLTCDREDYVHGKADHYAVAFDRKGRLGWQDNYIHDDDPGYDQCHVIEVLCSDMVSDAYLLWLREKGISYIFGGETELDLETVLEKLYGLFDIEVLLLEGGPLINEAFEKAGLIDELSLVQAPVDADEGDYLFRTPGISGYRGFDRAELGDGIVYLNFKKLR